MGLICSMTIPSRPAPAPPGSRGQSAAAGANASLEQLRLQLQQQHMQQQQSGNGLQKLTIKLPPPPKGPQQQNGVHKKTYSNNNNNPYNDELTTGASSITRKFPQARYTPATGWDDSAFGSSFETAGSGNGNGNFRKVPPPRPPPPKMQLNGRKVSAPGGTGGGSSSGNSGGVALITNIFHRKKSSATAAAAASKAAAQNRVYGLSSGHAAGGTTTTTTMSHSTTNSEVDWNAAWNAAPTAAATTTSHSHTHFSSSASTTTTTIGTGDAQLISFDSPPSSPTFTQKSNSDCVSVDSFSSDSNFSSPNNGSVSQPESGFEDDFHARSRPATNSPLDPWEAVDNFSVESLYSNTPLQSIGTAPVRQLQQSTRLADNPLCNGKSLLPPTQSLTMPTIIKPKISQKPKAPKPPPFLSKPGAAYGGFTNMQPSPESPPMPKVKPPPPPVVSSGAAVGGISLLDVITGKVDAMALCNGSSGYIEETQVPYAVALYDFDGVEEGDLNFRENEKIYLLEQPTAEWFRGRTRAGCEGIFPANYVEVMVPLEASASSVKAPAQPSRPTVRCLYNFPGEVEGDLSLREDEMVTVLYRINEDWLFGEVGDRQGQLPANFLEYVPDNLPTA